MSPLPGTTGRRRIYLMRHGHVDYFSDEVRAHQDPRLATLTEQGQAEAAAAGDALSRVPIDLAVSSGLRRTEHTARIVLEAHDSPPELETESRLEELHSGRYIAFESREQLAATMTFQFEQAGELGATFLEGGEAFADALDRVDAAIIDLLARPGWSSALVVAHEGINRLILSWAIGAPLGASAAFEQDTGCINILDFDLTPEGESGVKMERALIKAVNLTPQNYLKNGMNLRSLEAIFSG